jgi:hypothetical protein
MPVSATKVMPKLRNCHKSNDTLNMLLQEILTATVSVQPYWTYGCMQANQCVRLSMCKRREASLTENTAISQVAINEMTPSNNAGQSKCHRVMTDPY